MNDKSIVVIGGGAGTNIVLRGLKRYTSRLTALISTFDATSRRQSYAVEGESFPQSMGEVRGSLIALGADKNTTQIMERLFAFQQANTVEPSPDFGDLFLAALTEISGGADLAMQAAAQVLNVQGKVFPITLEECPLIALQEDGTEAVVTTSQELTDLASKAGLRGVRLSRPVAPLDGALEAIARADIIVLGPADLYFNILAPLQIEAISEAMALSRAVKIFVCPLMTQSHLTTSWTASDFIRVVLNSIGGPHALRCVIANSALLPSEQVAGKGAVASYPVHIDLEECFSLGTNVIVRPVAANDSLLHDPEKLARTIIFLSGGRSTRPIDKPSFLVAGYSDPEMGAPEPARQALGKV
jgi:uncharacterized cofD-like protein